MCGRVGFNFALRVVNRPCPLIHISGKIWSLWIIIDIRLNIYFNEGGCHGRDRMAQVVGYPTQ